MKIISLIISTLLFLNIIGQEDKNWRLYPGKEDNTTNKNTQLTDSSAKSLDFKTSPGTVNIYQTSQIDSLTSKLKKAPYILGYTVQLEVSQQTSKIRDARYKLLKLKPDASIEEKYLAPNTYLYGGSFYTRTDAYEFKNEIKNYFPNAIVIARKMALPPIEKTE